MTFLTTLSRQELNSFLKIIEGSLSVRRHDELLQWLMDDVQIFIPHDILIAAWGDFSLGLIHWNVISNHSEPHATKVEDEQMLHFLLELFGRWVGSDRAPFAIRFEEEKPHFSPLAHVHSAVVQGIKDERGRHDCLYVALSGNSSLEPSFVMSMELLLPYIDAVSRQVAHIPVQYPDNKKVGMIPDRGREFAGTEETQGEFPGDLSQREIEIMRWVCMGKTNAEIAQILGISFFTVKNHLQRIFRKINVLNRAQAVAKFEHIADLDQ